MAIVRRRIDADGDVLDYVFLDGCFYVWLCVGAAATVVLCARIAWMLWKHSSTSGDVLLGKRRTTHNRVVRRIVLAPLANVVFWMPMLVNRIEQIATRDTETDVEWWRYLMLCISTPMQGFAMALIFAWSFGILQPRPVMSGTRPGRGVDPVPWKVHSADDDARSIISEESALSTA